MRKSKIMMTTSKLASLNNQELIDFNHILQRPSEQWNDGQKSLLIHSLITDYPIPEVYATVENGILNIIDGKQRLSSIISYIKNEYKLVEGLNKFKLMRKEYDISDKSFKELPEILQTELMNASIEITKLEDYTYHEIADLFYRLNNGTQLTKMQQAKAVMTKSLSEYVIKCTNHNFMTNKAYFTPRQIKNSENETAIIQSIMMLSNLDFDNFSESSVFEFLKQNSTNINSIIKNRFTEVLNYLDTSTDTQYYRTGSVKRSKFIRKINVPILAYVADYALSNNIPVVIFKEWIVRFEKDYNSSGYRVYCGAGSIKREKILGRKQVAMNHFKKYIKVGEKIEDFE